MSERKFAVVSWNVERFRGEPDRSRGLKTTATMSPPATRPLACRSPDELPHPAGIARSAS
jgi:hypothetical protein